MKTRLFWLIAITMLALLVLSGTVFAEGEVPPTLPEEPAPVVMEVQPIEPAPLLPVIEEALPAGEPMVEIAEEPILAVPAVEPALAEATVEEVTALSADPQIVVIDAQGEAIDMASQASAAAIASADPYFTSGGFTYHFSEAGGYCAANYPGDPNCFDGQTNAIQSAINYIQVNGTIPTNGMIYVEKATYNGAVSIDGSLINLSTLMGLIGLPDAGMVFPTINNNVTIANLASGFTLSGFTINGAVDIDNVTGVLNLTDLTVHNTSGTGITVANHKGHINLTNVKSSYNRGSGALLENYTTGNVTIKNSAFDGNNFADGSHYAYGAGINTSGIISIDGLSASRNNGDGLNLTNFSRLTLKNAVLNFNDTSPASTNYGYGLYAHTAKAAPVTLDTVFANNDHLTGIYILTGAGAISLNHIEAKNSGTDIGAVLSNTTAAVSVSNGTFSYNTDTGLAIYSYRAVTLTSIRADYNGVAGVWVDNCDYSGSACTGSGNVVLTSPASGGDLNANSFIHNTGGDGLYVISNGSVTLTNLEADMNTGNGVYVDNRYGTGSITINKNLLNWNNYFGYNTENGLILLTSGNVTMSDSNAGLNFKSGLVIPQISTGNVAISRADFSKNGYYGLEITSRGSVTLTDVSASENDYIDHLDSDYYSGVYIDNTMGTGSVTIKSSAAGQHYDFNSNTGYGIYIVSKGIVSVGNVNAFYNGYLGSFSPGLYANNSSSAGSPAVNVTRSEFGWNGAEGLAINSKGLVTLTDVSASENDSNRLDGNFYSGVRIDNTSGTGGVTIKSSIKSINFDFNHNTYNGITINSNGAVSVSNATASLNDQIGLYVDNSSAAGSPAVSVALGIFENNKTNGVRINSKGAITLTDTQANSNGSSGSYNGADLDNTYGSASGVTVKSSSTANRFSYSLNTYSGLSIRSRGAVTVNNVFTELNDTYGVQIGNFYAASAKSVAVSRSAFASNAWNGLYIQSIGSVTLDSIQSTSNGFSGGYSGVYVDVCYYTSACTGTGSITLRGSGNEFVKNNSYGLEMSAFGSIFLNNFTADGNGAAGATLYTLYTGSSGGITISASSGLWNSASYNADNGLTIYSNGNISISRMKANENMALGAYLYNPNATPRNVTLNDCTLNSNEGDGVQIRTSGAVAFSGVAANWNSIHYGTIADEDAGEAIYERLTSDTYEDRWYFAGDAGDSYTIELLDTEFEGLLELYDSSATLIASDDSDPFGSYAGLVKIVIPNLLSTDDYYVRVSGGTGDYILYFDSWSRQQWSDFYGAYIQNTSGSGGVTINSSAATNSVFNENNNGGIGIFNPGNSGAISINNTSASGNGYNGAGDGMHIETGTGNVSITTSGTTINSSFDWNNDYGIYLWNEGSITLSGRIFVNSNLQNGALLLNYLSPTAKPVTISGVTANWNQNGSGLDIQTIGNISLTSITAMGNASSGVNADNWHSGTGIGNLTVTGINIFSDNSGHGLAAFTNGIVSITGVNADGNGEHGITLSSYVAGKTVSLKNITTLYNTSRGLSLYVSGATTLDTIKSYFNGIGSDGDGLYLYSGTIAVTIKNSTLIGNEGNGIDLDFSGTYTLTNTSYFGNDTNNTSEPDLYIH